MAMHDLRTEISHGEDWVYVWCPCGWKTEVKYRFRASDVDAMKREFHAHLHVIQFDGDPHG